MQQSKRRSVAAPSNRISTSRDHLGRPLLAFRNAKLNLKLLSFSHPNLARLHQMSMVFPLFYDVPVSLFLDYNTMVVLVNLGLNASSGRNAYFVILAVYGLACAGALLLAAIQRLGFNCIRIWEHIPRPRMLPVHLSSLAFGMACLRDLSVHSFLQHVRLVSWQGRKEWCPVDRNRRDFVCQESYWLWQNWPTVLLHIPKALIAIAILVAFKHNPTGMALRAVSADSSFFTKAGGLSQYSTGVLIANAAWCAWRLLVLFLSAIAYIVAEEDHSAAFLWGGKAARETSSAEFETAPVEYDIPSWVLRTEDRIRSAACFCFVPPNSPDTSSSTLARKSTLSKRVPVPPVEATNSAADEDYRPIPLESPPREASIPRPRSMDLAVKQPFDYFTPPQSRPTSSHVEPDDAEDLGDQRWLPFSTSSLPSIPVYAPIILEGMDETGSLSVIEEGTEDGKTIRSVSPTSERGSHKNRRWTLTVPKLHLPGDDAEMPPPRRHSRGTFGRRTSSSSSSQKSGKVST